MEQELTKMNSTVNRNADAANVNSSTALTNNDQHITNQNVLNINIQTSYSSQNNNTTGTLTTTTSNQHEDSYTSSNDLTMWPGAALIVADCMGTGVLALPNDLKVLGGFGLFFLIMNLPINYYAGDILHKAATSVERRLKLNGMVNGDDNDVDGQMCADGSGEEEADHNEVSVERLNDVSTLEGDRNHHSREEVHWQYEDVDAGANIDANFDSGEDVQRTEISGINNSKTSSNRQNETTHIRDDHRYHGIDSPHTFDFIGITYALFDHFSDDRAISSSSTRKSISKPKSISKTTMLVTAIYYINIFLVLGNYILVMSHAVAAMIGEENICLPIAGIIASTLMFAISQLRTMAMLGRSASVISLVSLAIVVIQCLIAIQSGRESFSYDIDGNNREEAEDTQAQEGSGSNIMYYSATITFWQSMVSQLAALSSIGFAVGSQKLFLNIRHEFQDRKEAPKSLAIALTAFGAVYVLVCVFAGPDPPSLLFDAIASGVQRRIAGFLLWVHVAVSFAINSQALCSSLDRLKFHRVTAFGLGRKHKARWGVLTLLVGISSYLVANAIPFFKDLVALIGALTSVPLTLLLPALYLRKVMHVPLFWKGETSSSQSSWSDLASLSLVFFSVVFMTCGIFGSISSIEMDWANHGPPFACH